MNLVPTRWYTPLFMPSTIAMVLIVIGLWLLWRSMQPAVHRRTARTGFALALGGLFVLYAFSTPLVATLLATHLLVGLFSNRSRLLLPLRRLALDLLNGAPLLRRLSLAAMTQGPCRLAQR